MVDEQARLPAAAEGLVRRLVRESGITEEQALELIGFLGANNWPSLMREARIMAGKSYSANSGTVSWVAS